MSEIFVWFWLYVQTDASLCSQLKTIIIQIKFLLFLNKLTWWQDSNVYFGYARVSILLDNCPFHKSNIIKNYLMNSWFNVFYLPAYSPQMAPMEIVFNTTKKKVIAHQKDRVVNWSKSNSGVLVLRVKEEVGPKVIAKCFSRLYSHLGQQFPYFEYWEN